MMFIRKSHGIMLLSSWVVLILLYFTLYCDSFNRTTLLKSRSVWKNYYHEDVGEDSYKGSEDYLIKTAGCYIPNYAKTLQFIEADEVHMNCGVRAIFVDKVGDDIKFRIDEELMKIHRKGRKEEYTCCFRFVSRRTIPGREESGVCQLEQTTAYNLYFCLQPIHTFVLVVGFILCLMPGSHLFQYSSCMEFHNETIIKLEQEVLDVSCMTVSHKKTKSVVIYKDAYILVKKIHIDQPHNENRQENWNVLVLGMDTMSRARLVSSMPETFSLIKHHGWLDYKGYHKVGTNTFPNMMAFLTGLKMSSVWWKCRDGMSDCNDDVMWSKYKEAGYATAYGEDNLQLPDTFGSEGFRTPPTTHYMRPLYLTGETRMGNWICTKQVPSAISALNYALDFVETYKTDKFFGFFWLNSFSHSPGYLPKLLDKNIIDFFEKLNGTGALRNTFIFFLSDHGIRFGKLKFLVESYYEERLPMFFMWTPMDFRKSHPSAHYNLKINQNRLTNPYDLHETFRSILQLSSGSVTGERSEACPTCTSLFEPKSVYRTCASAHIGDQWCSCRNLTDVDTLVYEYGAVRNINVAVSFIQNLTKFVKTAKCTKCSTLQLKKVIRAQMQVDYVNNVQNYVIAFEMSPGGVGFEVSLQENNRGVQVVQPILPITAYKTYSNCVLHAGDEAYCVCKKLAKCN